MLPQEQPAPLDIPHINPVTGRQGMVKSDMGIHSAGGSTFYPPLLQGILEELLPVGHIPDILSTTGDYVARRGPLAASPPVIAYDMLPKLLRGIHEASSAQFNKAEAAVGL
jgi:hypothetical protein